YMVIKNIDFGNNLEISGSLKIGDKITDTKENPVISSVGPERKREIIRHNRQFVYRLLCQHLGRNINSYGVLTGVRPVKLVHQLMDKGLDINAVQEKLINEYLLSSEKAELLTTVALTDRPFLLAPSEARKKISLYIGIPFCPSRCYYCSFPGAVLINYERDIVPFISALEKEIIAIGDYINDNGMVVQSIYLGGGTPTVLNESDLEKVFNLLQASYVSRETLELTVEAGRPDTLSRSKLRLLKQAGVSRLCINPQTMNNTTLQLIGRNHDCEAVVRAFGWAREAGIRLINMDIITGLPGETMSHYEYTADQILRLQPDNITVHTLAVKRGSTLAELETKSNTLEKAGEITRGVNFFNQAFTQHGFQPYYLYRQKYMRSSMENTGYSLPGKFCFYNMQMIEERQTIIGMGAGAGSKFVNPSNWSLTPFYNPKNPVVYHETVDRLISRKVDNLRALN
ncbi:MAG: coproporphyrinogen dehydrogenase HemZ, partial [Syntrophomonas sp.]